MNWMVKPPAPAPKQSSLLATGLVIDRPEEASRFPSAGGSSADPRVQAVYWRCAVMLFASARINNPDQRLALFSNVQPPRVDGVEIAAILDRYGVEVHRVPLTARLAGGRTAAWGNVLYFLDILADLHRRERHCNIALVDCDVLVTAPLAPLFARIAVSSFVGYRLASAPDEDINGMSRQAMAAAASAIAGTPIPPPAHFGGELFGTTMASWTEHSPLFDALYRQSMAGAGPGAAILTEEHIYSIALALIGQGVTDGNDFMKRIWTSPQHNTAAPGDETLPLWHLPAEKRYGLADMYRWLAGRGFPTEMPAETFHAQAMKLCGVPTKPAAKVLRDGVRQIASRLKAAR